MISNSKFYTFCTINYLPAFSFSDMTSMVVKPASVVNIFLLGKKCCFSVDQLSDVLISCLMPLLTGVEMFWV